MEDKYNILVIDDDPYTLEVFDILAELLRNDCIIHTFISFQQAEKVIKSNSFNLIILDIVMPETDGYEICKNLKQNKNTASAYFIFMSADKNRLLDRLKGYSTGFHDFISKPFDIKEIELIIKSKLEFLKQFKGSRPVLLNDKNMSAGVFCLEKAIKKVLIKQKEINLTQLEFKLMEFFMMYPEKALNVNEIGDWVWGNKEIITPESVRAMIFKLRSKIEENPQQPDFIINSKSNGYVFYPYGVSKRGVKINDEL